MMMLAAVHGQGGYNLNCPMDYAFGLSGTPLDEALATLNEIIPAFRASNDLNIVNLTIITDGCSNGNHWDVWITSTVLRSFVTSETVLPTLETVATTA